MYGATAAAVFGDPASDYRYIRITDIASGGSLNDDWKTADSFDAKYILEEGDLLFARSGATVGKTLLYSKKMGKATFAGYLIKFTAKRDQVLPRYLYHCVNTTRFWDWVELSKGTGAQPNIGAKEYAKFQIPLVDLEDQNRVVKLLDEFDALANDISQGLPAEIESRRRQYAYYRDKLLSFREKGL